MNEVVLYEERLPKYVFNGNHLPRGWIMVIRWCVRLLVASIFVGTIYLAISPKTEHDFAPVWAGIVAAWTGCALIISYFERDYQAQLDGNVRTNVLEDRISVPPRLYRKLTGKPNFILKEDIGYLKVIRGRRGNQYTSNNCGVCWKGSPTSISIITRSGKKIGLGYKPPSTVKEIVDVLTKHWDVRVEDPGSGMGRGLLFVNNNAVSEHSYDEIMRMNLFEWRE